MNNNLKTDWDIYYQKPYKTAVYSRKITASILTKLIKKFGGEKPLRVAELGGANSCVFEAVMEKNRPVEYAIIDNNKFGNEQFIKNYGKKYPARTIYGDILNLNLPEKFDLVFSVGLIEHFTKEETEKAIKNHFEILRPGGITLIFFPTPTWLYKATRFLSESLKLWIFHDERPIYMSEAENEVKKYGKIIYEKINWPIFLTQGIIAARKNE